MGAVAAGAIGSLITIAVALPARLAAIPGEIGSNDRRARERDEDLGQWIADPDVALRVELHGVRARLTADGMLQSGDYGWRVWQAKEATLHQWRDQERQGKRAVFLIYDREGRFTAFSVGVAWTRAAVRTQHARAGTTVIDACREPPSSSAPWPAAQWRRSEVDLFAPQEVRVCES